jgi:ubiquinone/menaquinone biosynthesis C-methylase UbiE
MIISKMNYFWKRKVEPGLNLKKNDLVIDIGSGDKPFWRANVFMDDLSLRNLHRHTDSPVVKTFGVFVDGNASKTKFKDKAFDFSFCAHLLEHVEKPDLTIKEIMRISKKGYIEVPNGIIEFISPFHSHLWFILLSKKKLIFIRKNDRLHKDLLTNSRSHNGLVSKVKEPFIRLYWKNKIEYEILDYKGEDKKYMPPQTTPKNTGKNKTMMMVGNSIYLYLIQILRITKKVDDNTDIKKLLK